MSPSVTVSTSKQAAPNNAHHSVSVRSRQSTSDSITRSRSFEGVRLVARRNNRIHDQDASMNPCGPDLRADRSESDPYMHRRSGKAATVRVEQ